MTPRQVAHYRLDRLLGSGGMGDVYEAYDTRRERYVALKLLSEEFSGDEEYVKRFRRESQVAARLQEPHVIPIHDFGEVGGQLFIDMRLVDGADIGALLEQHGRIPPQRAVHFISQVALALDAAHADDLVHGDIKPSNILVKLSDFVYVVDFGIAQSVGSRQAPLTSTGAPTGTPHYMAPEWFAGGTVDGRADVYSLACVLYECLTGAAPFKDEVDLPALLYAHLASTPVPASSIAEGVPPALDDVIARGMAKAPEDRFPTAGALAVAARQAALAGAPTPLTTGLPIPTRADVPVPPWQTAAAAPASQGAARTPGSEPEPVFDRSAPSVHESPTQTMMAVDGRGGTRPPENSPPSASPEPGSSGPPPRAATHRAPRRPGWRVLSALALLAVAAVAVPVAFLTTASAGPNTGDASRTATARPSLVAVPTVAEKIPVGQSPSYVQVAPNGKFAYVANPGARTITVLNVANDQVSGTIHIPEGPPQFVSFSPDGQAAYVSVYNTRGSVHLIAFIDTATGTVTSTVSVNNRTPGPSTTSPDGRYLYVPNHNMVMGGANDNVVDVIDMASKKLIDTIAVPPNPHWVAFGKNGQIYVTDHMSTVVTVLNASNNSIIKEIQVGETPHSEALSPDGSRLVVTSYNGNEVFVVNTATDQKVAGIPVGRNPLDIAYSPDGRYIYTANNEDNTVTVINAADNRVIAEVPTGKAPTSISVLPNGRQAYVTDENDGTIEVLDLTK